MSVNAAAGHSGRARMLTASAAFVSAKPDPKRTHGIAHEVRQPAFPTSGHDKQAEGITAGRTLDVKL